MKFIYPMIAVAGLAFTLPAQAATSDPVVVLYRASGVADGGSGSNTTTVFSCTPFSGVTENIRVVIRDQAGALLSNFSVGVAHLATKVIATGGGGSIYNGTSVTTGLVAGGTVAIAATSTSVTCTAMLMQFTTTAPVEIQLHMTRFNPLSGTQE